MINDKPASLSQGGWLNSTEFIWCPGCPMNWLTMTLADQFEDWGLNKKDTWMISGIGCTGRIANYFSCNSVHTTHGRAIPVAEGVKLNNPQNNVFVVSGDGDLLSIGLSHLIHAARRNARLKIICVNNSLYGMTGGQTAPTSPADLATKTYPSGTPYRPLPIVKLLESFDHVYYRQVKAFDSPSLKEALSEWREHNGFSFIEIKAFCITNDPRIKEAEEKQKVINGILRN
jgi:2-oxoglutarate/2-oxoacid ferredoxin oxidoreductase subunit beta